MLRGYMIFKICNAHHHLFVQHLSCMLQFWQFCRVAEEVLCDFERWDRKNHHMRHSGGSRSTTWAHVHIPHTETVGLSLLYTTVFLNLLLRDESWWFFGTVKITVLNRFHNPQKNVDCTNGIVCILYKFLTLKGSIFLYNILNHFLGSFSSGTQVGDSSVLSKLQNSLESPTQRHKFGLQQWNYVHSVQTPHTKRVSHLYHILDPFLESYSYETQVGDSSVQSRLQNSLESTIQRNLDYDNRIVCIMYKSLTQKESIIFTTYLTLFFESFTYETHLGDSSALSRLQNSLESTTPHKYLYCNNCISVQSVERSQSQLAMRSNNGGVVQNQQHNNSNHCNNNNN